MTAIGIIGIILAILGIMLQNIFLRRSLSRAEERLDNVETELAKLRSRSKLQ